MKQIGERIDDLENVVVDLQKQIDALKAKPAPAAIPGVVIPAVEVPKENPDAH